MAKHIKNNSGIDKTWVGQLIVDQEYYEIQFHEESKWANDSTLLTDIANGVAIVNDGTVDITDVNSAISYLKDIAVTPKDTDGATLIRPKAAKSGWTYHLTAPEFKTSELNSLYHKDISGNDLGACTAKYYDTNNVELTTQGSCDTDCVKTVFSFEPTWDYEIIGGTIKTFNDITVDMRAWVIAVPDIPAAYGGSKVMVQGVNLKYIDPNNGIVADGRVSKYMTYSATLHTNKLQVVIKHPAGAKEDIMVAFELYRA